MLERTRRRKRILVILGILVPALLVGVSAFLAHQAKEKQADVKRELAQFVAISRKLQAIFADVAEAESAQRGYLLTEQNLYLEPYERTTKRLPAELHDLELLVAGQPVQQERYRRIAEAAQKKLHESAETIALQKAGRRPESLRLVETNVGIRAMDTIRATYTEMIEDVRGSAVARQEILFGQTSSAEHLLWGLVAMAVLFAGVVLALLYRLSKARLMMNMCAWSRTVEFQGEWLSFENYMLRRFNVDTSHGISPSEAEKIMNRFPSEGTDPGPPK